MQSSLHHEAAIALRPPTELTPSSRSPAIFLTPHLQQQEQCQQPPQQQQQQHKRKQKDVGLLPDAAANLPWLGAKLDVGGYTKRGFISGGGKDQNQDRSVTALQDCSQIFSLPCCWWHLSEQHDSTSASHTCQTHPSVCSVCLQFLLSLSLLCMPAGA